MSFTIAAIILFALGASLIASSNIITYKIIGQVNERAGSDQQFSLIFVSRKWPEILARYREFAPNSRLPQRINILGATGIVLFFVGFILLVAPNLTAW